MSTRPPSETPAQVATTTDAESGLILIDNGNIKKKILKEGTGPTPTDRSDVTVHYTGRLLDGTVFDSSKKRNEPFVFKIGQGQVIKGWDKGVATMRVGEHAILTCSPEYAYGARGSPPTIPPNATLEFEVELLSFDNTTKVTDDGGVKKSIQQAGTGHNRPNDNATVTIKYTGRVKGSEKTFVDQMNAPVTVQLGTADALARLPYGLEEGIKNMHVGERANFVVQPAYGFGDKGDAALGIPAGAVLEFSVELVDMTKGKEGGELAFDEKLAYMTALKEHGNAVFKQGLSYDRACKIYTKVVHVFPYDGALDEEQKKKVNAVKISAMSNNALCKMKQLDYDGVVQHATAALAIDPKHVKCLFYRAQAYLKLGKGEEAEADLKAAAAADPANKEVARELNAIKARKRAEAEKEKKAFGGFFGRVKLVSKEEEEAAAKAAAEAKARAEAADSSDDEFENDEDEEMPPAAETATTEAPSKTTEASETDTAPMVDTAAAQA